ncbi:MAG: type II toxin-antitoxin system VapC family toxin [Terriglobales bacterium]
MIVDTSAVVSIAFKEPEARRLAVILRQARQPRISAPNYVEAALVISRYAGQEGIPELDDLLAVMGVAIAAFTAEHAVLAREAHRRFGRGSGHPAKLNLGDCYAYALAQACQEPLLYIGDDFLHTDVRPALRRD